MHNTAYRKVVFSGAFQVGHHIARVTAFSRVFDLGDDPPLAIPTAGCVVDISKPTHLGTQFGITVSCIALPLCGEGVQALVLGDADNVTHVVALAPQQHPPAAKTGVATEDNSDLWPDLSQSFNQQSQDRPGMLGAVDLARAQVTDQ